VSSSEKRKEMNMSKQQDTNKQKSLPQEETAELTDELLEAVTGGFMDFSMGNPTSTGGGSWSGPSDATGGAGGATTGNYHNHINNNISSNSANELTFNIPKL
jgi:hypothetical protein